MEIRVIGRVIEILTFIGKSRTGVALTEIAQASELSKSTTHRILQTLRGRGFVRHEDSINQYFLGSQLISLVVGADPYEELKAIAHTFLKELRDKTGETVALVVRDLDERLTIDVFTSTQELRAAPEIGSRRPVHAGAAGKALLSTFTKEELEALCERTGLVKITSQTTGDISSLIADVSFIKKNRYGASYEETVPGQSAVAFPIYFDDQVLAVINVCGPSVRFTPSAIENIKKWGFETRREIEINVTRVKGTDI